MTLLDAVRLGVCVIAAVERLLEVPVFETVDDAVRVCVPLDDNDAVKEPVPVAVPEPVAVRDCDANTLVVGLCVAESVADELTLALAVEVLVSVPLTVKDPLALEDWETVEVGVNVPLAVSEPELLTLLV